jgi:hypothetical protein
VGAAVSPSVGADVSASVCAAVSASVAGTVAADVGADVASSVGAADGSTVVAAEGWAVSGTAEGYSVGSAVGEKVRGVGAAVGSWFVLVGACVGTGVSWKVDPGCTVKGLKKKMVQKALNNICNRTFNIKKWNQIKLNKINPFKMTTVSIEGDCYSPILMHHSNHRWAAWKNLKHRNKSWIN